MSFLSAKSRASLLDLGNFVDAKIARLRQSSRIETEQFRQAQYINWCNKKLIPDPYGSEPGYECIVACFIENLIHDLTLVQRQCKDMHSAFINSLNSATYLSQPISLIKRTHLQSFYMHESVRRQ